MRLSYTAIIHLLFTFVAFILCMLCIFSGSKPGCLVTGDMLTLNTSMLGDTTVKATKSIKPVASAVKSDISDAKSSAIKKLGIYDFYSAHMLNYCEGFYHPTSFTNGTAQPFRNVTKCSHPTTMFHFDAAAVIQAELKPGIKMTDIKWPAATEGAVHTQKVASERMFVLYSITAAFLGAIVEFRTGANYVAWTSTLLRVIAFIASLTASVIATSIIDSLVSTYNKHGNAIGIFAYKGMKFLGMTWAATILISISAVLSLEGFFKFILRRGHNAN